MNDKKRIFRALVPIAVAATLLCGCAERKPASNYVTLPTGFALGTSYNCKLNIADTTGLRRSIDSLFEGVSASMSVFDPNSLLNRLNRNETDSVDAHIAYCIETAAEVSRLSGGEYDITIKPVVDAWGFNAGKPGGRPDLDSLMQFVGYSRIRIENGRLIKDDPRTQIDLNSIAKGYAVDLLAGLVESRGATDYMVEVGGEIVCKGVNREGRPWLIGIDKPMDGNYASGAMLQASIALGDGAMATSGNYRKFYTDEEGNKIVHTISGVTGESRAGSLLSATVIADKCIIADACATMLMSLGLERARELLTGHEEIKGYLIYADGQESFGTFTSPALERRIKK